MNAIAEHEWLSEVTSSDARGFYAAVGIQLPDRGQAEQPVRCFANPAGHKLEDRTPSCSINTLTGLWKCHGCGQSGNAYSAAIALGYQEPRARELARQYGLFLETAPKRRERPKLPSERRLEIWREQLRASPKIIARLGELKGWTLAGMVRCGLGWNGERVTFPIRNERLRVVGLVRYLPGGQPKVLSVPGGKRELFPAPEVISKRRPLFVVEGEPAAVALWSCGVQAVGVPGAGSWRIGWLSRLAGRDLVVLPDCDVQGRELAAKIGASGLRVRVVDVEPGRSDGLDIGDWVAEAAGLGGLGQVRRVLERLAA